MLHSNRLSRRDLMRGAGLAVTGATTLGRTFAKSAPVDGGRSGRHTDSYENPGAGRWVQTMSRVART